MYGVNAKTFEQIALSRLPELQVASGLFRATARVEGVEDEGAAPTTLRAGVVVLLGLLRADEMELGHPFRTGALRTKVLGDLSGPDVTPGDLGLALWAESRADGGAVSEIRSLLQRRINKDFDSVQLEDLAWVVSGLTETSVRFGSEGGLGAMLDEAASALRERVVEEGGLLEDVHRRRRGHVTPVGSQFHALSSLCQLKRAGFEEIVGDAAQNLATALGRLQRADGAWPGLVDPKRGEAVAFYPVLTVTQVSHAVRALRYAAGQGLDGDFENSITSGLAWANGQNALSFDLIHESEARLDRGIVPRKEPGAVQRGFSSATRRLRGGLQDPDPSRLILDPAVSSEDLGWVLEAWAGR
ncbi:MAG: hypothetical protein WBP55_01005 [Solirubrobacterales bacterium]